MNLFDDAAAAQELLFRLSKLFANTPAHWGKMNAAQMMAHCQATFKVYFGEIELKRNLVGILFGKTIKRRLFAPKPWAHNLPTATEFKIVDERNFEAEREKLIEYINRFASEGRTVTPPVHAFFGKLSLEEWGLLAYRHTDHHLKQFGA